MGPESPSESIRALAEAVQANAKRRFLEKYNFNLDTEQPVEGLYKWEKVWSIDEGLHELLYF